MVALPITHLPTIESIYKMYREKAADFRRGHLGASQIGKPCERDLWFSFRWASDPGFEGRILRLFDSGYLEEDRIIKNLRSIGVTVFDRDPAGGEQLHYKEDSCPMFSGSVDGIAQGFEEAPATWHILECKTSSKKLYDKLFKEGVEKAKPEHFIQMQIYMHWTGLKRAYYIACCKDDDRLYGERVYYDKDVALRVVEKAKRIVNSEVPLEKISYDPENFQCKWCNHIGICHGTTLPLISCRTCAFVTIRVEEGIWECGRTNEELSQNQQKAACEGHIFIPQLVPLEQTDADSEVGTISYGDITNGPGAILSKDLQKVIDELK